MDDDEDEDDNEFDEDEEELDEDEDDEDDEFDGDEGVTPLKSDPRKSVILNNPTQTMDAKSKSPDKMTGNQNKPGPEYIDLDVT